MCVLSTTSDSWLFCLLKPFLKLNLLISEVYSLGRLLIYVSLIYHLVSEPLLS